MRIAVSGPHGAGKTTLVNAVLSRNPAWTALPEATRTLVPILGFDSPQPIIEVHGIAFFEAILISHWCVLEGRLGGDSAVVLTDRSPVDNLAYYYLHRTEEEHHHEGPLRNLALHYLGMIDFHIRVPLLETRVELDPWQRRDTQRAFDTRLSALYEEICLDHHVLTASGLDERAEELIEVVGRAMQRRSQPA